MPPPSYDPTKSDPLETIRGISLGQSQVATWRLDQSSFTGQTVLLDPFLSDLLGWVDPAPFRARCRRRGRRHRV